MLRPLASIGNPSLLERADDLGEHVPLLALVQASLAEQFRASGLNLVIAAIVYWNSTYLADAVDHVRSQGQPVSPELLAHTSPLTWGHIGFSGDFLWDRAAALAGQRRPLNLSSERRAA